MDHTLFEVLRGLDNYFSINDLPYCVVGRTQRLDTRTDGDIDIIIRQSDVGSIHLNILQFCKLYRLLLIQCVQHERNAFCYVIAWFTDGNPEFLKLDICGDYHRRGRLYLGAEELLFGRTKTRVDGNGKLKLFLPSPSAGFLYYLLKKIDQGILEEGHGLYLHDRWKKDPEGCRRGISRFWNKAEGSLLARAAETNDWTPVRAAISGLGGSLHRRVPVSWRGAWGELSLRAQRVLWPTGLIVAFPGRESAAKESLSAIVESRIAPAFSRCARYDLRPEFLSLLTGADGSEPNGAIASTLTSAYCRLSHTIRCSIVTRWRKVYSTLILFDRYCTDMIADRDLCRSVTLSIASFVGKCIPKPDFFVVVTRSRDIDAYTRVLKGATNAFYALTNHPLEDVSQEAVEAILGFMNCRTVKKLKIKAWLQ